MALKTDKKKMDAIIKSIEEQINARYVNNKELTIQQYGVTATPNYKAADIAVVPNNGCAFFCIEKLVLISQFYGASFHVSNHGGKLTFMIHGINKF